MKGCDVMKVVRAIVQRCRTALKFCISTVAMMALFLIFVVLYGILVDRAIRIAVLALAVYAVYGMFCGI
jgi:hypothetical protein